MEKRSFILYCDFKEQLDLLDYEEKGRLIEAIFDHECGEPIKDLPPMVKMAFASIRPHLLRNAKEWETSRKKRSEAGKKSGEVRRNKKAMLNNAEQCLTMFNNAEHNVNVNDNDNVNVNENGNGNVNVNVNEIKDTNNKTPFFSVDNQQDMSYKQIYIESFHKTPSDDDVKWMDILFENDNKELIIYAFEEAAKRGKHSVSYVKGILKTLNEQGVKKVEDIKRRV